MIVLDASVLVAYLDGDDTHHAAAEALLKDVVDDQLAASPLTLAELLVVSARNGRLPLAQAALRDLEVAELPFPQDPALLLAQLRASTQLKMPDCCALLAAESSNASLASFDDQLVQAAADRGLQVLGR